MSEDESWPCLIGAACKPCQTENCDPEAEDLARELHNSSEDMDTYPAEIEYKCPLGMEFQDPEANDTTHPIQTAECGWDGLWHLDPPVNSMMNCTWVACANPPFPEGTTYLVRNYSQEETIQFGDSFNYTCPPGHFFDEDRDISHISATCLTNGSFSEPVEWKRCVDEKSIPESGQHNNIRIVFFVTMPIRFLRSVRFTKFFSQT